MELDLLSAAAVGAAAVVVGYAIAFLKLAWPSAPGWALVLVAIVSGVVASVGLLYAGGAIVDGRTLVGAVFQGFIAAAGSAGLTRTDSAGERARISARADSARASAAVRSVTVSTITTESAPDAAPGSEDCPPA